MTHHISSCTAVNGDADNTVTMKDIRIGSLTGLDVVGNNAREASGQGGSRSRL